MNASPAPECSPSDAEGWERRERLNKSDAQNLLDWLEANDYAQREVILSEDNDFTVRWQQ